MASIQLSGSVGIDGDNVYVDILAVQKALNTLLSLLPGTARLAEDGSLGRTPEATNTVAAIKLFQSDVVGMQHPDGRIDPGGRSHRKLNQALAAASTAGDDTRLPDPSGTQGLTARDYQQAASALGCDVAAIRAVEDVESSGAPFFASGRPKILYEAHIFSRETGHKFDESHPDISSRRWDRSLYIGGEKEYDRLQKAMALNRAAALKSASWGKFQIMGFNHKAAAFDDIEAFVTAMFQSEAAHMQAFVAFIKSQNLGRHLVSKNWAAFAEGYNGKSYAANKYELKLKAAYEKHQASG